MCACVKFVCCRAPERIPSILRSCSEAAEAAACARRPSLLPFETRLSASWLRLLQATTRAFRRNLTLWVFCFSRKRPLLPRKGFEGGGGQDLVKRPLQVVHPNIVNPSSVRGPGKKKGKEDSCASFLQCRATALHLQPNKHCPLPA